MDFQTQIESGSAEYKLEVLTSVVEPETVNPKAIYISVCISKIVGKERQPIDTIIFKYITESHDYLPLSEIDNLDKELYNDVVKMLAGTYGGLWGFSLN